MRVAQFHSGSAVGDAVTNSLFYSQSVLNDYGIASDIYVQHRDERLADQLKLITDFEPRQDDLLLIHHSMGHDIMELLTGLPCRKLLCFHNITPPDFFAKESPFQHYARLGLAQLQDLRAAVSDVMAYSDYSARDLARRGFADVSVIPLLRDFAPLRVAPFSARWHYFEAPRHQLLFVGRICENKGQLDLVRFVARHADSFDHPLHLTLVGRLDSGDAYHQAVIDEIERSRLTDRVLLAGHVSEEDLYGHYRAADAYVSFSEHEGFGVPLIEAMAFDVPVLAYDVSAIGDTLGSAGIKLRTTEPDELVGALHNLFSDRAYRRQVVREQRRRLEFYDRDSVGRDFIEFVRPHLPPGIVPRAATTQAQGAGEPAIRRHYVVEGPCETSYSLAIVNRALGIALDHRKEVATSFRPAEGVEGYVLNEAAARQHPDLVPLLTPPVVDADATVVSIRNMYPPRPAGMLGDFRLSMFFWEESEVPWKYVRLFNRYLDGVIAPTEFGRRVYRNSGMRMPIVVSGQGVDHRKGAGARPASSNGTERQPFRFLHISSGLARKGIEELFLAYAMAFTADDSVELIVKTYKNPTNVVTHWYDRLIANRPHAPAVKLLFEDLGDADMEALLGIADAVVLPTRGEGFNLPAAEAMAAGIPVITTGYSAHLDFCHEDNAYLVDFDFERTGSHVGGSEAMWARARVSQLSAAMRKLSLGAGDVERKVQAAKGVAAELTWAATAGHVEDFVRVLQEGRPERRRLKLAWVSTWNIRCGIATYSNFLLDALIEGAFEVGIFADQQTSDKSDGPNVVRCWTDRNGTTDELVERVLADRFDVAVIQFNFGFHALEELGTAVRKLEAAAVPCYVFLHATSDTPIGDRSHSLREIRDDLALATRLVVHSVEDVNRLKGFGLVDNVMKLPHGVHRSVQLKPTAVRQLLSIGNRGPIIACYGFLLPGKGLPEVIAAVALLRTKYPDSLLLLVNSAYPNPDSEKEQALCLELVAGLDLGRSVVMINNFLDNDVTMVLLQAADVVVFAYQNSRESASGAVRYGLSSLRPVVTTPLGIFQDIQALVHQTNDLSPAAIADGIATVVEDVELRAALLARQEAWLDEHCWERIGEQFSNMVLGLYEDRFAVTVTALGEVAGALSRAGPPSEADRYSEPASLVPEAVARLAARRLRGGHVDAAALAVPGGEPFSADRTWTDENVENADRAAQDVLSKVERILFKDMNRGSDAQFVRRMYSWILQRKPEAAGFAHHVANLEAGQTRADLVRGVLTGEELRRSGRNVRVVFGPEA